MSILTTLRYISAHPLNRTHRARALLGFVKWQLSSRLVCGPVAYSWIGDTRFLVSRGETGLTGNIYCGLHEFQDMAYVLHTVCREDLFVDVGANAGSYTLLACGVKNARGICIEPVPQAYRRLLDNLRLNDLLDRVSAFNLGVAGNEGELLFTTSEDCTNHVLAKHDSAVEIMRVAVQPLDRLLEGLSPTLIKIDVEGYEQPVLEGAHATMTKESLHSVIMELNGSGQRYGFCEDAILDRMKKYGFSTFSYDPLTRSLTPLHGKKSLSGNTLFIRGDERIRDKLHAAPPVKVGSIML
ncbi:MAG: FkbM family methyltransferase [Nitrospirae bacterium]|nr:FkbM family methyltransferase [Nitrospirota bacterium]MBU6482749.1 FkbM family methyltransferase [Nitrospirota bacterium]